MQDESKWWDAEGTACFPSRGEEEHGAFRKLWMHHLVAGVVCGWLWGVEARDVGRGQIIKDLSVTP